MHACLIRIRGLVQGVGLRPTVWRLARELGLNGWVRNDGGGVTIAVAGKNCWLLADRLREDAPRLARIDDITVETFNGELADSGFAIRESGGGDVATAIGPDAAVCPDCIADLCDPAGRRWRYPFTTCTHCGPRFTVSRAIPYDRARTSLAAFPLCPSCAAEYADPADRRFHAETTACPSCGPRLELCDAAGRALPGDPFAATLAILRAGGIVALKGLGGFQLACDARNPAAVAALRARKQRDEKPFAVMALNAASLAGLAVIGPAEAALLGDRAGPIVLCRKGDAELPGIAPGLAWLGALLPTTPLHLLLWHEAAGRPAGTAWLGEASDLLLVMTSANPHGEPLVTGNGEALERLAGIADAFLMHDRDIVTRCDDSVLRPGPAFIRRARGYTPLPVPLAGDGSAVLALGGHLKNTVCVAKGEAAYLSQHVGGLDNAAAIGFLEETVVHLLAILEVRPQAVAHDLHPDFASTRLAARLAAEWGVPALAVGHHHAHLAALAAEHGIAGPLAGLALDGVGLGPDGGLWGGELLRLEGGRCRRLGHLAPLALPGGERAAREPWRMALAALHAAGRGGDSAAWLARRFPGRAAGPLPAMLARGLRCPPTTSLGRLFDAAAGLIGVRAEAGYEGQAAMELEGLAAAHGPLPPLAGGFLMRAGVLDFAPLLSLLADCDDAGFGAALFHATVAAGLAAWAAPMAEADGRLACGGGCAMNAVLMAALRGHLEKRGIELLEARQAPPNDGGLALGQAWAARRILEEN